MIVKPSSRHGSIVSIFFLALALLISTAGETRAQWIQTTPLPVPYSNHTLSFSSGFLYQAGGITDGLNAAYDGTNVLYAQVNADGTIGNWNGTTSLPQPLSSHAATAANGFLYILGGASGLTFMATNTVYYDKINADGTLGAWQNAVALPQDLQDLSASVWNNRIYVVGGYNQLFTRQNTVYSAAIQANGSLSSWTAQAPLPVAISDQVEAANGSLYVIGGAIAPDGDIVNTVYFTKINADGTLAGWNETTALPQAESAFGGAAANGTVFAVGGVDNDIDGSSNLFAATVGGNGAAGLWANGAAMPQALYFFGFASSGSHIFVSGGEDAEDETSDAVYSLALPAPPPPTLTPLSLSGGDFFIQLTGAISTEFGLQASTNLLTWSNVAAGFTGTNGVLQFEDTNAAGFRARYYRACWPAP